MPPTHATRLLGKSGHGRGAGGTGRPGSRAGLGNIPALTVRPVTVDPADVAKARGGYRYPPVILRPTHKGAPAGFGEAGATGRHAAQLYERRYHEIRTSRPWREA
jgi:hypothetical protein